MKINQFGRLLLTNSFLARIVQMRKCFLTTCTKPVHKDKNIKQMSCYRQEKGRSMVEMLGVLAIIGVLSVGAIAGYSKAMNKYRLNKQSEQLQALLSAQVQYKSDWSNIDCTKNPLLKDYFIKLDTIPSNMIKSNSAYLFDVFNNQISIQLGGIISGTNNCLYAHMFYYLKPENSGICLNVFNTIKEYHEDIYRISISENSNIMIYGDKDCSSGKKCINHLNITDINEYCNWCNNNGNCTLTVSFFTNK